ncbi:MAG: peptidoglycan binding domain-containing protein [Candidatus Berkelbacteria bacterium]
MEILKKIAKISAVFLGCLLALSIIALISYQQLFKNKVYYRVSLSGTDVSGMKESELRKLIEVKNKQLSEKNITLKAANKETVTQFGEIGVMIDADMTMKRCYGVGRSPDILLNSFNIIKSFFDRQNLSSILVIKQEVFDRFVSNASKTLNTDPVNATIAVRNGQIVETSGEVGYQLSSVNLPLLIIKTLNNSQNNIVAEVEPIEPNIQQVNLLEAKNKINHILDLDLTLDYGQTNFKPTLLDKGNWVKIEQADTTVTASLDQIKIATYLDNIKNKVDVSKVDRKVESTTNAVITEGRTGVSVNKDKTIANIVNAIDKGITRATLVVETANPSEIKYCTQHGVEVGKFAGKYLDANLTTQRMCQIDGYDVIKCLLISSGAKGMSTPTGSFKIYEKVPRSGSAIVVLNWWQRFAPNGYGIHEIPQTPEGISVGADQLGTIASHGCIRLGIGDAESVFNWTEMGTNLYIHY